MLPAILLLGVALIVLALCREFWLHLLLPAYAVHLRARGERARAKQVLGSVIAAPSLFGERARAEQRFRLAWFLMEEGRYEEAAAQCRVALEGRLRPAVESAFRRRLADCLEALGDPAAADEQRHRADASLETGGGGADLLLARARSLDEREKHQEACDAYREALAHLPARRDEARAEVMVRLALASLNAGLPEEALRWAEEALATRPLPTLAITARNVAGIGCSTLGRLNEAEKHWQEAFIASRRAGNEEIAARCRGQLALVQLKRGRLTEAMEGCEQAAGMSLVARRQARSVEAEALRLWGRYDEARTAYEQARRAPGHPQPAAERRSQAILLLGQAWLEAEAGQPEAALRCVEEAAPHLERSAKMSLWRAASLAWVLALLGRGEEARAQIAETEAGVGQFAEDPATRELCWAMIALAAAALGARARCREAWERYLALGPPPVFGVRARCELGECHLELGEREAARDSFREAVAAGIDTRHARLARRRLDELEDEGTP